MYTIKSIRPFPEINMCLGELRCPCYGEWSLSLFVCHCRDHEKCTCMFISSQKKKKKKKWPKIAKSLKRATSSIQRSQLLFLAQYSPWVVLKGHKNSSQIGSIVQGEFRNTQRNKQTDRLQDRKDMGGGGGGGEVVRFPNLLNACSLCYVI